MSQQNVFDEPGTKGPALSNQLFFFVCVPHQVSAWLRSVVHRYNPSTDVYFLLPYLTDVGVFVFSLSQALSLTELSIIPVHFPTTCYNFFLRLLIAGAQNAVQLHLNGRRLSDYLPPASALVLFLIFFTFLPVHSCHRFTATSQKYGSISIA